MTAMSAGAAPGQCPCPQGVTARGAGGACGGTGCWVPLEKEPGKHLGWSSPRAGQCSKEMQGAAVASPVSPDRRGGWLWQGRQVPAAEQALECSAQLLGVKDVENKALVERGLSPAQPSSTRPGLCCVISLLLTCLTCPQGWVTLPRAAGRAPRPVLYRALKITSAEGERRRCLKWKCSHCCGSAVSPFRGVHSEVPSKAAPAGKEQLQGEVGAGHLLPEEQFAVGRTKMQIRNQSIYPLNALVICNSSKRSHLGPEGKLVNPFSASCTQGGVGDCQGDAQRAWLSCPTSAGEAQQCQSKPLNSQKAPGQTWPLLGAAPPSPARQILLDLISFSCEHSVDN